MPRRDMIQNIVWLFFFAFAAAIVGINWGNTLWGIHGAYTYGKFALWFCFAAFTGYSLYCSRHENLFRSIGKIGQLHWGRQIGIDLYIGFLLFIVFIGLHQGIVMALIWALPVLVYGNQATLLYLAVYYESIAHKFMV